MVNEKILVKDKFRKHKKFLKLFFIIAIILIILLAVFLFGFLTKKGNEIVLENPMKNIIFSNTNELGQIDKQGAILQGIYEFNEDYINFLIIALGANNLHKSYLGYGNPVIEMNIDGEIWSTELGNTLKTVQGTNENKDILVILTKQNAVEALLSEDIASYMKMLVMNGETQIEMVAGKVELGSKGYLAMYKEITGEEISLD